MLRAARLVSPPGGLHAVIGASLGAVSVAFTEKVLLQLSSTILTILDESYLV